MSTAPPCVLGIDVGTTNLKLQAVGADGCVLAEASRRYGVASAPGGVVTQDPALWWDALEACLGEAGRALDLRGARALALSCQGETLVCCDAERRALEPAISWMDTRANDEVAEMLRGPVDWCARTGKPLGAYATLTKIAWLARHRPEFFAGVARFCQVADYLVARLCGRWICDMNNGTFAAFANPAARDWDHALLREYGIEGRVAELGESGTVAGTLRPDLAARWGLPADLRVVLGGHDQGCAALGAMPPEEPGVILSTGTAWVLYCPLERPLVDPGGKLIMYCHAQPRRWTWMSAYSGGGVLDGWIERFCRAEAMEAERAAGGAAAGAVYDALLRWEHLADDLIVIPYMFGGNTPENDPAARMAILGLGGHHRPGHVAMGIVEAIGFETRRNLEYFAERGARPARLKMMGGASRGALWPQLIADVCGLPIDALEQAEAAALGAAFLASQGIGFWPVGRLPRYPGARTFTPDPARRAWFDRKYQRYLHAVACERDRRNHTMKESE